MNEDFVWTKEEKANKLFKVLNVLKNNLQCKRMVVGGSMAMYIHGFNVEPHDLDIEMEGISDDSLRVLKTMAGINKDMKREKDYKSLVDYINQLTYFTR